MASMSSATPKPRLDDSGMEILGPKTCARILHDQQLGRIGFIDDEGEPTVLPVTYRYWRDRIYFLSSEGSKLRAATRGARVCFEVDGWDTATGDGWSVLVRGTCRPAEGLDAVTDLGFTPWLRSALRPMQLIEIVPDEVTGRRLPRGPIAPEWD